MKYIYGAFTGVTILAIAILALLRKPLNDGKARQEKQSQAQRLSRKENFRYDVNLA